MMRSMPRRAARSALLPMLLLASGCGGAAGLPPLADLQAASETKPVPGDEIASDPQAEAHYNAQVEGWGDRVSSAGARLCRFFAARGMTGLNCPKPQ